MEILAANTIVNSPRIENKCTQYECHIWTSLYRQTYILFGDSLAPRLGGVLDGLNPVSLDVTGRDEDGLECSQTEVVVGLRGQLLQTQPETKCATSRHVTVHLHGTIMTQHHTECPHTISQATAPHITTLACAAHMFYSGNNMLIAYKIRQCVHLRCD